MSTDLKTFYENEVPAQNSTDNDWFVDVIGQKTDNHNGDSLYSLVETLEDDAHSNSMCYPVLANPVALVSAGGVWTLGAFIEIVPINTITDDFDIHWVTIYAPDANADYIVNLYYGATDIPIGCIDFGRSNNFVNTIQISHKTIIIPANSRIRAKMADSVGGSGAGVKVKYHEY